MAKYLCDFDSVNAEADKIIASANSIKTSASSFSSKFNSNLSSWNGTAKNNLINQSDSRVSLLNSKSDELKIYGEYIKKVVLAIQKIEDELCTIEI